MKVYQAKVKGPLATLALEVFTSKKLARKFLDNFDYESLGNDWRSSTEYTKENSFICSYEIRESL
jgi:hypothetical protein